MSPMNLKEQIVILYVTLHSTDLSLTTRLAIMRAALTLESLLMANNNPLVATTDSCDVSMTLCNHIDRLNDTISKLERNLALYHDAHRRT